MSAQIKKQTELYIACVKSDENVAKDVEGIEKCKEQQKRQSDTSSLFTPKTLEGSPWNRADTIGASHDSLAQANRNSADEANRRMVTWAASHSGQIRRVGLCDCASKEHCLCR